MSNRIRLAALAIGVVLSTMAVCVAPALGAGTGVDLTTPPETPSSSEAALLAANEAAYQEWLGETPPPPESLGTLGEASPPAVGLGLIGIVDAPFYYMTTPSHRQLTNYYCGPATCQIIDDYWGAYTAQQTYAAYGGMCPTSDGTVFSLLDNTLRHFTGKSYSYYGGLTSATDVYKRVQYAIGTKHYPTAALVRIDGSKKWQPYKLPHNGHIFCLEAFDCRDPDKRLMRVNDPYDENAASPAGHGSAGGETYGHHLYPFNAISSGVLNCPSRAIVY